MSLYSALCFFTRLPVGFLAKPGKQSPSFLGVMAFLPLVGLVIGTIMGFVLWLLTIVLPPPLAGLLACLAWVAITGGLHLDGVADCGDGMLVEAPPERRLVIMKDSRLGSFGAITLFFVLGIKATTLGVLAAHIVCDVSSLLQSIAWCLMAALLGRGILFWGLRLPSARPNGMGSTGGQGVQPRHELYALLLVLLICVLNKGAGLVALLLALMVNWLLLSAARKRLGGITGDVFGCQVEVTECTVLSAVCLCTQAL